MNFTQEDFDTWLEVLVKPGISGSTWQHVMHEIIQVSQYFGVEGIDIQRLLRWACSEGDPATVALLLEIGYTKYSGPGTSSKEADGLLKKDEHGWSAHHHAISGGRTDVFESVGLTIVGIWLDSPYLDGKQFFVALSSDPSSDDKMIDYFDKNHQHRFEIICRRHSNDIDYINRGWWEAENDSEKTPKFVIGLRRVVFFKRRRDEKSLAVTQI